MVKTARFYNPFLRLEDGVRLSHIMNTDESGIASHP